MDSRKILDSVEKTDSNRFGMLSFRTFLLTAFIILLFLIYSVINPKHYIFEYVAMILIFGFIVSSIVGFVFTIKSITTKESDTTYKTIGAIGNILLLLVMLSMIAFVIQDLIIWFE